MSTIDVQFVGGPLDGPNEAKDTAGFSWVMVPWNGKYAFYFRGKDGQPYTFAEIADDFEQGLILMRELRKEFKP